MNLEDIVNRDKQPKPWVEGDNIPWNEPDFSQRMLTEHLSQAHDAASRRSETIARQVEWIHREVLREQPSRILDLACGPGLYTQRLATLGHKCTGIDFSPASIAYAKGEAQRNQLTIRYQQDDIRSADFPDRQDLVMLISGEVNVFSVSDAKRVVNKAAKCLNKSGQLILEVHASGIIARRGQEFRTWHASQSGLWSDSPYICLQENFWDSDRKTATTRYFVTNATTGKTTLSSASYQDYSDDQYKSLLIESGFTSITRYPSLAGITDEHQKDFMVLVAGK